MVEECLEQLVMEAGRDENRARAFAPLTVQLGEPSSKGPRGGGDISISPHDGGIVAATFELQRFQITRRR